MKIKLTNSPLNPTPQSQKNGEGGGTRHTNNHQFKKKMEGGHIHNYHITLEKKLKNRGG